MKPLEKGRRSLIWMGIKFADDEPVSRHQNFVQKSSAIVFAITFIAFSTLHVITFSNVRLINPEEFFFVLVQFVFTAHGTSAFIMIYSCSSRISNVFQILTQIYKECK